jgi:hypothetical protein
MAAYRWTGATSGVWKLKENWIDIATGAIPVAKYPGESALTYDDVYFDTALAGGASSVAGVSALTEELNKIYIGGTYNGTIGSAITPVEVDMHSATAREVFIDTLYAGAVHIKGMAGAGEMIQNLYVLNGTVYLYGKYSNVHLLKGTVTLDAGANIAGLMWVGYMVQPSSDISLAIPSGATLPSTIQCNGGIVTCSALIGMLYLSGGTWTQSGGADGLMQTGGTFMFDDSNITSAYVYGGTFDTRGSSASRTIDRGFCGAGGTMYLNPVSANLTVTNSVRMLGGTVAWTNGADIGTI